ncbi:hypothetical protein F5Y17DRAFT_460673 [Xylariaceae sp. FL0594]|nr:hypothetical protein F5Y17DRAFT_460673 [Xylariaceae sp. FL0594]
MGLRCIVKKIFKRHGDQRDHGQDGHYHPIGANHEPQPSPRPSETQPKTEPFRRELVRMVPDRDAGQDEMRTWMLLMLHRRCHPDPPGALEDFNWSGSELHCGADLFQGILDAFLDTPEGRLIAGDVADAFMEKKLYGAEGAPRGKLRGEYAVERARDACNPVGTKEFCETGQMRKRETRKYLHKRAGFKKVKSALNPKTMVKKISSLTDAIRGRNDEYTKLNKGKHKAAASDRFKLKSLRGYRTKRREQAAEARRQMIKRSISYPKKPTALYDDWTTARTQDTLYAGDERSGHPAYSIRAVGGAEEPQTQEQQGRRRSTVLSPSHRGIGGRFKPELETHTRPGRRSPNRNRNVNDSGHRNRGASLSIIEQEDGESILDWPALTPEVQRQDQSHYLVQR